MKIKQIQRQYRRDFWAIFRCEACGHECEEREIDPNYRPLTTKYPEGMQV